MVHTVKDFSVGNETEVDDSLKFPCFLYFFSLPISISLFGLPTYLVAMSETQSGNCCSYLVFTA